VYKESELTILLSLLQFIFVTFERACAIDVRSPSIAPHHQRSRLSLQGAHIKVAP